jgi:hypothetical protein
MISAEHRRKVQSLAELLERSHSSPRRWHEFYRALCVHAANEDDLPPKPLILAGSACSNASKHKRLSEQLDWSIEHGCFEGAMQHLLSLTEEEDWNSGTPEHWEKWP